MIPGAVLFDLDGTITESGTGITKSVAYALQKQGIVETDRAKLNLFVGPPLLQSFQAYYGFTPEQARQGVEDYREYYAVKGIYENRVYDGVEPMLKALRDAGRRCILATAKPEHYAVLILKHFGLSQYFEAICGATMDTSRTNKEAVIAYLLEQNGRADNMVMVGDTKFDVIGAKAHGIPTVGVSWGYGEVGDMVDAGAVAIADTAGELLELLRRA